MGKQLFVVLVFLFSISSVMVRSQNNEIARCQEACNSNCESIELIRMSACRGLCIDHCVSYSSNDLSSEQAKCLLTCKYLKYDEEAMCKPLCKVRNDVYVESAVRYEQRAPEPAGNETEVISEHDKKDVSNVCTGFGRELCYKICRLHHSESIETCLCACCKCKF